MRKGEHPLLQLRPAGRPRMHRRLGRAGAPRRLGIYRLAACTLGPRMRSVAVCEVRGIGVAEEEALPRHVPDPAAKDVERQLTDRRADEHDDAFLRIIQARDEIDERARATARCADQRECAAGGNGERHVSEHPARFHAVVHRKVTADRCQRDGAAIDAEIITRLSPVVSMRRSGRK